MDSELTNPSTNKKISPSKLMGGDSPSLGKVGQDGESNTGKLARILRTTRVKVNKNEKDIKVNIDKLMNTTDEVEQIHETLFDVVSKQGEVKAQVQEQQKKGVVSEGIETLSENLNTIAKELKGINTLLGKSLKRQEKNAKEAAALAAAAERKRIEEEKEEEKDSKEKSRSKSNALDFIKKPVTSFFDKVKKFFGNILAGAALVTFVKWLQDPANQTTIDNFVSWVTDTLPLILAGIAAIATVVIGTQLIGAITGLLGVIKGLTFVLGLGGGVGLLAILGAVSAFLAAKFIEDTVRPVLQDITGGVGYTETGLQFGYEDIVNLRNEQREFLAQQGVSGDSMTQQLKKYDDLLASMRSRKSINDDLAMLNKDIKRREEQIKRQRESGDTESADRNQALLDNRLQQRKQLQNDLAFANRQVTLGFTSLNVSESDLEADITARGGQITRIPSAVAPDLRVGGEETGEGVSGGSPSSWQSGMFGGDAMTPESNPELQSMVDRSNKMTESNAKTAFSDLPLMELQPTNELKLPEKDVKMDSESAFKMDLSSVLKDDSKNVQKVNPPVDDSGIDVLGGGSQGGGASGVSAASAGSQSSVPSFSPYDTNNPTTSSVMAIYNALS